MIIKTYKKIVFLLVAALFFVLMKFFSLNTLCQNETKSSILSYQWIRDDIPIDGENSEYYVPTKQDINAKLRVQILYSSLQNKKISELNNSNQQGFSVALTNFFSEYEENNDSKEQQPNDLKIPDFFSLRLEMLSWISNFFAHLVSFFSLFTIGIIPIVVMALCFLIFFMLLIRFFRNLYSKISLFYKKCIDALIDFFNIKKWIKYLLTYLFNKIKLIKKPSYHIANDSKKKYLYKSDSIKNKTKDVKTDKFFQRIKLIIVNKINHYLK